MATWPTTLPQSVLLDGYQEQPVDNLVRSSVDQGPEITRPRYTATPVDFDVAVLLTQAQCDTLDAFYDATLSYGSTSFDWLHPRTGAAASFKFRARPGYQAVGGGFFRAALALRKWP